MGTGSPTLSCLEHRIAAAPKTTAAVFSVPQAPFAVTSSLRKGDFRPLPLHKGRSPARGLFDSAAALDLAQNQIPVSGHVAEL